MVSHLQLLAAERIALKCLSNLVINQELSFFSPSFYLLLSSLEQQNNNKTESVLKTILFVIFYRF